MFLKCTSSSALEIIFLRQLTLGIIVEVAAVAAVAVVVVVVLRERLGPKLSERVPQKRHIHEFRCGLDGLCSRFRVERDAGPMDQILATISIDTLRGWKLTRPMRHLRFRLRAPPP
jgi:hypothetical protein